MDYARIANQAAAHLRAGDLDQAERGFRAAAELAPRDREVCLALGTVLYRKGRLPEALEWMRKAVTVDPGFVQGHNNLGYVLMREGRADDAIRCFNTALSLDENDAEAHGNLGDALQALGRSAEAIASYRRCLRLDDRRPHTWNNLGNALTAAGQPDEARRCYEQALAIRPDYRVARANLEAMDQATVPLWHFLMLADTPRNTAYQRAIERAVGPGSRVLDIGTGSGLLAMMAARAGADSVVACEANAAAAAAAGRVVAANGLDDTVRVVPKRSTDLVVGEDLDEPVNVIVHEIVDSKLVGEGVLPSLRHALTTLASDDVAVIPSAGRVHAMLASLPDLAGGLPLAQVCGFDLSAFDRMRDRSHVVQVDLDTTAHVALTDPVDVVRIPFDPPPPSAPDSDPHRVRVDFTPVQDGVAHAVVFWFTLELDDAEHLSTGPGRGREEASIHWRQVAWFLPEHRPVQAGNPVRLDLTYSDWRLGFEVVDSP